MNRTDFILAGFTSVAVITICFLTYQILKEPEPKMAKVQAARATSTPLGLSYAQKRARSQQVREHAEKLKPATANFSDLEQDSKSVKAMLISATDQEPRITHTPSSKDMETSEAPPLLGRCTL